MFIGICFPFNQKCDLLTKHLTLDYTNYELFLSSEIVASIDFITRPFAQHQQQKKKSKDSAGVPSLPPDAVNFCVVCAVLSCVTRIVNSLLVYDHQELLKIKASVDFLAEYGLDGPKTFSPPHLANIPAHPVQAGAPLPRRRRRRGSHTGQLVRLKARLALQSKPGHFICCAPPEYRSCLRRFLARRFFVPVGIWLIPVVGPYERRMPFAPACHISSVLVELTPEIFSR